MSLSSVIGRFTAEAAVPDDAVRAATVAITDCVACAIAGADTDAAAILRRTLVTGDGHGDGRDGGATLLGAGGLRAEPRVAALVNGTAAHALDYDDINWTMYGHPSVAILPAALALAEAAGCGGRSLVEAYAVGVEVSAKLGRWANPDLYVHGWHATGVLGALGAAAAASRLLGLDAAGTATAIGIAASEAAGVRRNFGSMVKPFHAGRAAESGVLAARLAQAGYTADPTALEGAYGFLDAFRARSKPGVDAFADALGAPFDVVDPGIVLKRYPSCGATHCALDALLHLKAEHGFAAADIEEIECGAEPLALKVLQHPRPRSGLEGKFSMEFCLAVAVVDGAPGLRHFAPRWIEDPAVRALLPRIRVVDRPDLGGRANDAVPAEVAVVLRGGRRLSRTVQVPAGDPRAPMTEADRRAKFLECTRTALGDEAEAAWEGLLALPSAVSLAEIMRSLRGPAGRAHA